MTFRCVAANLVALGVAVLSTVLFLAAMFWCVGVGQIAGAYARVGVVAAGVTVAAWWFAFLGLRALAAGQRSAPARGGWRRACGMAVSACIAVAGALSALLAHHGSVALQQRIEASRANFTCGQIRRLEAACARLLDDTGKSGFRGLFAQPAAEESGVPDSWTAHLPEVLRKGRDADAPLVPEARRKLAAGYPEVRTAMHRWWRPMFSGPATEDGLVDAWERPFLFLASFPSDATVTVRSLGPDGIPSADDIDRDFLPVQDQDLAAFDFYDARPVNRTPFGRLYTLITGRAWLSARENILGRE